MIIIIPAAIRNKTFMIKCNPSPVNWWGNSCDVLAQRSHNQICQIWMRASLCNNIDHWFCKPPHPLFSQCLNIPQSHEPFHPRNVQCRSHTESSYNMYSSFENHLWNMSCLVLTLSGKVVFKSCSAFYFCNKYFQNTL